MDAPLMLDVGREAIWTLLKIATPIMMVALLVGLVIALFQALTQIQEATLTFVPKIVAIFFSLLLFMPFMFRTLETLNEQLHQYMVAAGG